MTDEEIKEMLEHIQRIADEALATSSPARIAHALDVIASYTKEKIEHLSVEP